MLLITSELTLNVICYCVQPLCFSLHVKLAFCAGDCLSPVQQVVKLLVILYEDLAQKTGASATGLEFCYQRLKEPPHFCLLRRKTYPNSRPSSERAEPTP